MAPIWRTDSHETRVRWLWLCSWRCDDCLDLDGGGGDDAQRSVSSYDLKGYEEEGKRTFKGYLEVLNCAT